MFKQTSCLTFEKYGCVLSNLDIGLLSSMDKISISIKDNYIDKLFTSSEDIYIRLKKGVILIIVSKNPSFEDFESYILNGRILIKKGVYYNFIPVSKDCQLELFLNKNKLDNVLLTTPYRYKEIVPTIEIKKIYTKFYQEKPINFLFKGEKHYFWELTFIDRGILYTNIDNTEFKLNQGDIVFYAPNQYHTQYTNEKKSCCYLTITFDMNLENTGLLSNKVFTCDKKLYYIINNIIHELNSNNFYKNELLICYLKQLVLNILNSSFDNSFSKPQKTFNQLYDDNLLNDILVFIHNNVCCNICINDLCDEFGISSSKLHSLFKNNLGIPTKAYINNLKLKKAKELITERKYNVSEIANIVGFSSIHYFSNSFKKKYGFSPSEYIKSINKHY